MKTKQRLYPSISHGAKAFCFVLLMLVTACGGQEDPIVEKEDQLQLSDKEILISADGWKPMTESRANIFETQDDFLNEEVGGGDFTLHAFTRGSDTPFIDGTRARYFREENGWRFYAHPNIINYYWPQTGTFDFLAYMPYKNSGKQKIINAESISYDKNAGSVTLACSIPNTTQNVNDSTGQETVIAYSKGLSKQTVGDKVNMHFVHPFAAIYIKLIKSHRNLKITKIQFNNVYFQGKTTLSAATDTIANIDWTAQGTPGTLEIPVNKVIPNDINFGGDVGGPYLVMPQDFNIGSDKELTITVYYIWDDAIEGNENKQEQSFTSPIKKVGTELPDNQKIIAWKSGYKYIYNLLLGDNEAEILFKVDVEPWDVEDYKHVIEVE